MRWTTKTTKNIPQSSATTIREKKVENVARIKKNYKRSKKKAKREKIRRQQKNKWRKINLHLILDYKIDIGTRWLRNKMRKCWNETSFIDWEGWDKKVIGGNLNERSSREFLMISCNFSSTSSHKLLHSPLLLLLSLIF